MKDFEKTMNNEAKENNNVASEQKTVNESHFEKSEIAIGELFSDPGMARVLCEFCPVLAEEYYYGSGRNDE